ncbi:MAG: phosphatidate cytidylyltransferase [Prolixibacteraceae bacterium]|nr:phosphatidate cytidylyltransferase [Prolixibacteraceae bacterium]
MNNFIILTTIYLLGVCLMLIFNELSYRWFNIKGEFTRKFAHFVTCIATIPLVYIFNSHWYVLILASIFFIALMISQFTHQLGSINDVTRKSYGGLLLPVIIYIVFYISWKTENKFLYILPMIILGVCDPMAAILGMHAEKNNGEIILFGIKTGKSYVGSFAFFIFSFIISIMALYFTSPTFDFKSLWLSLLIAFVSMIAEMISWRGSDNLTIPLSVVLVLILFQ